MTNTFLGRSTKALIVAWTACLLASAIPFALASDDSEHRGNFTDEFHKSYPLSAQGRISIDNLNGPVTVTGWDRPEVKVDAIKSAWSKERLDEAKIEVDSAADSISIRTTYPSHDNNFNYGNDDEHHNPARVEYTIMVPRRASLDEVRLVNGRLEINGVSGEVRASCVNGKVEAHNLQGRVDLKSVNGELNVNADQIAASGMKLSTVNGRLRLTLPSDSNAEIKASTVSGNITDDFGLPINRHQYVGRSLHGQLGGGGTLVSLSTVNGMIQISHANDNRPLSPARNLDPDRGHDKDRDED